MDIQDKESLGYKIPAFGQHVVVCLFNPARWDAALVPLGNGPLSPEAQADYTGRGLRLIGLIGFINGKLCSTWEHPVENNVVEYLGRRYAEWLRETLVTNATPMEAAGNVAWLRELFALQDPRKEN